MFRADVDLPHSSTILVVPSAIEAAPPAPLDGGIVVRALVVIHDQIAEFRSCDRLLQIAREMQDARTFHLVGLRVARAQELIASSFARIRRPILEFDSTVFGRPESFGELGLRGQMYVVELQRRRLEALFASPPNEECAALAAQFPVVAQSIRVELALATALWKPYRKAESTISAVITDEQRLARYHAEILAAEQRLYAIASEPRIEDFLFAGTACSKTPDVQSACAMIHRALQIRVTGYDAHARASHGARR
jgi:hypothetical protein